jgi:hypothetical protein
MRVTPTRRNFHPLPSEYLRPNTCSDYLITCHCVNFSPRSSSCGAETVRYRCPTFKIMLLSYSLVHMIVACLPDYRSRPREKRTEAFSYHIKSTKTISKAVGTPITNQLNYTMHSVMSFGVNYNYLVRRLSTGLQVGRNSTSQQLTNTNSEVIRRPTNVAFRSRTRMFCGKNYSYSMIVFS